MVAQLSVVVALSGVVVMVVWMMVGPAVRKLRSWNPLCQLPHLSLNVLEPLPLCLYQLQHDRNEDRAG